MNNNTLKKKKQLIRKRLRNVGILPEYGKQLNDEQKVIWEQINQNKFDIKEVLKKEYIFENTCKKICKICNETNYSKFYNKEKSKCKKCILIERKKRYINNEFQFQNGQNWKMEKFIHIRVSGAKHRAKRKKIIYELTDEIILEKLEKQEGKCYITNIQLELTPNDWRTMSIDRIDSNIGYTVENTILVTWFVNQSKNKLTIEEFIQHIKLCYHGILKNPLFSDLW